MGFRFSRSLRVFPGVRLNFSRSGISTSVGVRGATVTVGPRGSHVNLGLPGTGLSFQQPLAPPSHHHHVAPEPHKPAHIAPSRQPPVIPVQAPIPTTTPGEIKNAANDQLTSVSLRELRDLLISASGLNKEFMFSSDPKTEVFAAAFARHRASLPVV